MKENIYLKYQLKRFENNKNDTVKLNDTETNILNIIKLNNNITYMKIGKKMDLAEVTVKINTLRLRKKGLIERVGADKNGYWKVK